MQTIRDLNSLLRAKHAKIDFTLSRLHWRLFAAEIPPFTKLDLAFPYMIHVNVPDLFPVSDVWLMASLLE